ncbi:MAG: carbohydrate ABC transporter permease [Lachnospiraceae bacterium]|jgi:sn-glycerol 3-phosphate transport system permease protein|nr:carbohydrate ABC transporter permease [Lachnospiraceae bacterium]
MRGSRKRRAAAFDALATAVAICIGLAVVFPIVYCVLGAFKTRPEFASIPPTIWPESFHLDNFREVLAKTPMLRYMLNSLITSTIGSGARILFALLAAYAFAFYEFKGKNFFFFLVLATTMLPADTLIVTNYLTVSRLHLMDNYLGMSIIYFVGATQMFMLRQHFRTIPQDFRDAATLDGCGDLGFITRVLLPISRPVVMTLFVQSFVTLWNVYLWTLLVTNKDSLRTVQVGITMLTTVEDTNYSLVMAGVALLLIPSFILFIILQRNIVKGMLSGGLVG